MYLKSDRIVATVGNIVMRSSKTGTGNEFILDPTAVTGWTDGTDVRRSTTSRPVSNGDFYEPATNSARAISFTGTAVAKSRGELEKMRNLFVGTLRHGGYEELFVETSVDTKSAIVGLEGTTSWVQQGDTFASWRIGFYAPEPYLFGREQIVQAGADVSIGGLKYVLEYPINYNIIGEDVAQTVRNNGNVPSYPKFKVTGNYYSGFTVTDNLNHRVTYTGMVTSASPVTIDMAKGTAVQNGVDKTVNITERGWFSIPAQTTIRPSFVPIVNGAGWCDIIFRDTWI